MTIIAAVTDGLETWIGSDALVSCGDSKLPAAEKSKWVVCGDRALGTAGWARVQFLLRSDLDGFIKVSNRGIGPVVGWIKGILDAGGMTVDQEAGPWNYGNAFLYAEPGRVWDIDSRLAPHPIEPGFLWARGSGEEYAIGAGRAFRRLAEGYLRCNLGAMMLSAIEAAIEFDKGCGGEVFCQNLGK